MSTQPLGAPRVRFFDSNGDPLSGGKLYTYAAGTSTPQSTYTDRAGGTPNANPVVLDASGEADVWLSQGVDYKLVLKDSADVIQWTVDNYPTTGEESASTDVAGTEPGGRLTLTSGTPVTTSDVTGATTIYYVPHKSDKVPLYDGASWALYSIGSTGVSQTTGDNTKSPAAVTTNSNYDLFVWNDSGTIRLSRGPAWTSDTARGTGVGTTELQQVNGRYVNKVSISNGPGAQRGLYVGTVRSDASSQINDSVLKRHVWNAYSRVQRTLQATDSTGTWTYTTAAFRQARANTANQVDMVFGLSFDAVHMEVSAHASNATPVNLLVGVGLDSTSALASGCVSRGVAYNASAAAPFGAAWVGYPGIGRHYLVWLEWSTAAGTTTWYGSVGGNGSVSGMYGTMFA